MGSEIELIILLGAVAFIIVKYISIINNDTSNRSQSCSEKKIINNYQPMPEENTSKDAAKQETSAQEKEELSETDLVLQKIPGFNKESFLSGAKKAFEIILSAFSRGDTETLEKLVSKNIAKKFQEILNHRQAEGITSETDFISFSSAEITDAKIIKNDLAKITVKFISEQVNLLRNKNGDVIEGDEQYIQNITDIWTFERNITSTSPNWLLTSTKKS